MTRYSDWPHWLQALVLVPHGLLASVMCWIWWPKSEKGWTRFGLLCGYLILFFSIMHFVFGM